MRGTVGLPHEPGRNRHSGTIDGSDVCASCIKEIPAGVICSGDDDFVTGNPLNRLLQSQGGASFCNSCCNFGPNGQPNVSKQFNASSCKKKKKKNQLQTVEVFLEFEPACTPSTFEPMPRLPMLDVNEKGTGSSKTICALAVFGQGQHSVPMVSFPFAATTTP